MKKRVWMAILAFSMALWSPASGSEDSHIRPEMADSEAAVTASGDTYAAVSKADDAICRALKKGDYSAFAGTYEVFDPLNQPSTSNLTLRKNGTTSGGMTNQYMWRYHNAPVSVTQMNSGGKNYYHCVLKTWSETNGAGNAVTCEEYIDIFPAGVQAVFQYNNSFANSSLMTSKISIIFFHKGTGGPVYTGYTLKKAAAAPTPTPTPTPSPASTRTRFTLTAGTKWKTGTTTTNGKPIIYTYTVPARTCFSFQIQAVNGGAGSRFDFVMSTDEEAYVTGKANLTSYKSGYYTNRKKGRVTIKIYGSNRSKATKYQIRLTKSNFDHFEQEPNNSAGRENALKLGGSPAVTYTGLASSGDTDYYSFIAPSKGTYRIQVRTNTNSSIRFRLYNSDGKLMKTISGTSKVTFVDLMNQSLKKNKGVYIRVDGGKDQLYYIRISKRKA